METEEQQLLEWYGPLQGSILLVDRMIQVI